MRLEPFGVLRLDLFLAIQQRLDLRLCFFASYESKGVRSLVAPRAEARRALSSFQSKPNRSD